MVLPGEHRAVIAHFSNGAREVIRKVGCCSRLEKEFDDPFAFDPVVFFESHTQCPFCDQPVACTVTKDKMEIAKTLHFGRCDDCNLQNRVLNIIYYEGIDVGAQCKFGCEDELSSAAAWSGDLQFIDVQVERLEVGHLDSKWRVVTIDTQGDQREFRLVRFQSETAEELQRAVMACTAYHEVQRLSWEGRIHYD